MNSPAYQDKMGAAVKDDSSRSKKFEIPALMVKNKRKAAKMGMTISLGSLVLSGLIHFKGHKNLHIWSGIALLGFSFWHHRLNKKKFQKAFSPDTGNLTK